MIYLDSAALVKLIRIEAETVPLVSWLNQRQDEPLAASVLVEIEVPRALRRSQPGGLGSVAGALARVNRVDVNAAVRATAAAYVDPSLRTLDAIHLATAEYLVASDKPLSGFVTYDKRLYRAASAAGLPVAAPGAVI